VHAVGIAGMANYVDETLATIESVCSNDFKVVMKDDEVEGVYDMKLFLLADPSVRIFVKIVEDDKFHSAHLAGFPAEEEKVRYVVQFRAPVCRLLCGNMHYPTVQSPCAHVLSFTLDSHSRPHRLR
jgi:hypothetical protein